jgi:hypothetical protein
VTLAARKEAAYDASDDQRARESGNMISCAAGYGLAARLAASRLARLAPLSSDTLPGFGAEHTLGLGTSW